jgi:hypothetical protein
MADPESAESSASGPTVSVMSSAQVTELITSLVTAISGLEQKLSNIETELHGINQVLFGHLPVLSNIERRVIESGVTVSHALHEISDQLETDITDKDDLNMEYNTKIGVRSIGYTLASYHEAYLKRIKESESDGESSEPSSPPPSADNIAAVNDAIIEKTEAVFEGDEDRGTGITSYNYGIDETNRIMFQRKNDFVLNRYGLPFDFTRYFVDKFVVNSSIEIHEYALLPFESTVKTSTTDDSDQVERMKTWKDYRIIQTVVIITNKLSNESYVYLPIESDVSHLVADVFKDPKKAMDYVVSKYQDIIKEQHIGIAFVPVQSIQRGIYNEEYRTAAKSQAPVREYT